MIGCCFSIGQSWPRILLTHRGRVTHICVIKLTTIGSNKGLSPDRRQAIIWTNAGILLIGPLGTNFRVILIEENVFENVVWKMAIIFSRPQCVKSASDGGYQRNDLGQFDIATNNCSSVINNTNTPTNEIPKYLHHFCRSIVFWTSYFIRIASAGPSRVKHYITLYQ